MNKFITPQALPTQTLEVLLLIPDSPEFKAILRGFFEYLSNEYAWKQLSGLTITPQEAALWAQTLWNSYEAGL